MGEWIYKPKISIGDLVSGLWAASLFQDEKYIGAALVLCGGIIITSTMEYLSTPHNQ